MGTIYTYSISTKTYAGTISPDALTSLITASSISSATLLSIDTSGDVLNITFNGGLSNADQTTLNGLISGQPAGIQPITSAPSTSSSSTPTYSSTDITVPLNTQMLVVLPVQCDGYLILNGNWVEIS